MGLPELGHVEPLEMEGRVVAAKLTVYAGEPEEYVAFVTPEAYGKLLEYMKFREGHGEKVTPASPLMRDRWQTTSGRHGWNFVGRAEVPLRLRSLGVKRLFEDHDVEARLQEGEEAEARLRPLDKEVLQDKGRDSTLCGR